MLTSYLDLLQCLFSKFASTSLVLSNRLCVEGRGGMLGLGGWGGGGCRQVTLERRANSNNHYASFVFYERSSLPAFGHVNINL